MLNTQCWPNREGVLCSKCTEGHSLAIGSSNCIHCPNSNNLTLLITPCACARDKAIGCLSAQKSPDLDISASEQSVSTTKHSKSAKNLHVFASNRTARLTRATNRAFCWPRLSTTPIYSCRHPFCLCAENWPSIGR